MKLTWSGIKAAIKAPYVLITSLAKLETVQAKAEAATKINELNDIIRDLRDRNARLEEEKRKLEEQLSVPSTLTRNKHGYYVENETGRNICGLCWEKHGKLISLLQRKRGGPAMASNRGGFSSWTEFLECPDCKTEYGHESKSKYF